MKGTKKYIISVAVLILLTVLTFFFLFRRFEFQSIASIIKSADIKYLYIAALMIPVYLLGYALTVRAILRSLGEKPGIIQSFSYGCIDFYYSAITPSSTGGQPMVIYHMGKDGIPISKAVLSPLLHTVIYKVVLFIFTITGILIYPTLAVRNGNVFFVLMIIGAVINGTMLAACLLSMFKPRITKRIGGALIRFMGRIHLLKDPEKKTVAFASALEEYQEAAAHVKKHKLLILRCFIYVLIQRAAFFLVPYFIYLSLADVIGTTGLNPFYFIAAQAVIAMSVDSLPIPGGMGVNEYAMIVMYNDLFGVDNAASAMLLTRGVSYYLCLAVSSIGAILKYAHMILKKRKQEKKSAKLDRISDNREN